MDEHSGPRASVNLAIKLPADVAALLHRAAYETGVTKRDLVINAIRDSYADRFTTPPASPPRT